MLQALLRDLGALPELKLLTLRDDRLARLTGPVQCLYVDHADVAEQAWLDAMAWADAVWPIAPESDGILHQLSVRILGSGRDLLGSRPGAVKLASSKLMTSHVLEQAGVPVVPGCQLADGLPPARQGWVVKPDDGAGSEEIHYIPPTATLDSLVLPVGYDWVVQPYVEGFALSLSVLTDGTAVQVLSCNEQRIEKAHGRMHMMHVDVQSVHWRAEDFRQLAGRVCAAIPGLRGYLGIDLQMTAEGPVVIEVNPRLTTAYAGLSGRLGHNLAEQILAGRWWCD